MQGAHRSFGHGHLFELCYLSFFQSAGFDRAHNNITRRILQEIAVRGQMAYIMACDHGYHRSQAVARRVGESLALQGITVCVVNMALFRRRLRRSHLLDFRAMKVLLEGGLTRQEALAACRDAAEAGPSSGDGQSRMQQPTTPHETPARPQ